TTVGLQEAELADKEAQILAKQQELALIEAKIQELMISSKVSEADFLLCPCTGSRRSRQPHQVSS
ncbi:MAG: hypothetical protein UZ12_BCD005000596, partial [Bacteroidetes bacterium OLB12]